MAVFKALDHDGFVVPDAKALDMLLLAWRCLVRTRPRPRTASAGQGGAGERCGTNPVPLVSASGAAGGEEDTARLQSVGRFPVAFLLTPWQHPEGQLSLVRAILVSAPELLNPAVDPALHSTMILEDREVGTGPHAQRQRQRTIRPERH